MKDSAKGRAKPATDTIRQRLAAAVKRNSKSCISLSEYLARNPEVSWEEVNAVRHYRSILRRKKIQVEMPFLNFKTAFRAVAGSGRGPVVALMAEYDALPGVGHACGHNLSGAISLLAFLALCEVAGDLGGTVWLIGTPAEETDGSKNSMASAGVFDGVDLAMMIHAGGGGLSAVNVTSVALEAFEFTFKGKSAHAAASPWAGRSALEANMLFFHAIDMMRGHLRLGLAGISGVITDGGHKANVVPERSVSRLYIRGTPRSYMDEVAIWVCDAARGAALATQTSVEWGRFEQSSDDLLPNEPAAAVMEGIFREKGIAVLPATQFPFSTDMGDVSHRCPALHPVMSITDSPAVLHSTEFAAACGSKGARKHIVRGAEILAETALHVFTDAELRARIKETFGKERSVTAREPTVAAV